MEAIFLKILNMSISATYLVLAVVLLRLLLKKAPTAIAVAMWALVGLRLVLPFSIESVLSLIPSAETVPADIALSPAPMIQSGIPAINNAVNPVISQSFAPNPGTSANPLQILIPLAAILWIVGMIAMAVYAFSSWYRIRRAVREAVPLKDNIYLGDRVPSPFILGIFRPRIYLPSATAAEDIPYILAHERAHLQRKDHLWKPLGFLLLTAHWFNPLVWVAYILLCRDIELACDEKVIKILGAEGKKPYSQALISCSVPRRSIAACPLAFGEVGVKGRIKSVLNYKKPAFWVILIAIILCVGLAIGFLTDPKEDTAPEITGTEPANMAYVDEKPVLMEDFAGFELNFAGNYSLQHSISLTNVHPVWCLTVENTGDGSIKVETQGTVYTVEPDTTAYIYATEDWAPGDYPVGFSSTLPMEGSARCSLHMSHSLSSGGNGTENTATDPQPVDLSKLPGIPGGFTVSANLDALAEYLAEQSTGLLPSHDFEVYIWQMAANSYSCVLLADTDQEYTALELAELEPVTIPQMRVILAAFGVSREDVTICPIQMPYSSYYYEVDSTYLKSLETLFWEPFVIQGGEDYGVTMELLPTGDLSYDLTVTFKPETATVKLPAEVTMASGPMCRFYAWHDGKWYALDDYLRDICGRTDIPEEHYWTTVLYGWTTQFSWTQEIDLKPVYDTLPPGQYRIEKNIALGFKNQEVVNLLCTADFAIVE